MTGFCTYAIRIRVIEYIPPALCGGKLHLLNDFIIPFRKYDLGVCTT